MTIELTCAKCNLTWKPRDDYCQHCGHDVVDVHCDFDQFADITIPEGTDQ